MKVILPNSSEENKSKVTILDVASIEFEVFNNTTYLSFIVEDYSYFYK